MINLKEIKIGDILKDLEHPEELFLVIKINSIDSDYLNCDCLYLIDGTSMLDLNLFKDWYESVDVQ